jgi:putative ABC transport system permease protein
MIQLLETFSLPYFRRQKIRTLLTLGGICLSVALFTSVQIVNQNIFQSFRTVIENIAGKTVLQVVGSETGFQEGVLEIVESVSGVQEAAPVIEQIGALPKYRESDMYVLGVDILRDGHFREYQVADPVGTPTTERGMGDPLMLLVRPHSILLAKQFADRHGLKLRDELELATPMGIQKFRIEGLLLPQGPAQTFGGNFAVMDVYSSQIVFGKAGKLDRIDIVAKDGIRLDQLQSEIAHKLPSGLTVEKPERRSLQVEKLLASFQVGLSLVSFIALFVSGFIVYNTVSFSCVQRYRDIGILQAIGATKQQIKQLFTAEAIILSLTGSGTGILLGLLLAKQALILVSDSVSSIYAKVDIGQISLPLNLALEGFFWGIVFTLSSAFFSFRRIAHLPVNAVIRQELSGEESGRPGWLGNAGVACLLIAIGILSLPVQASPYPGYLSSFLILLGFSILTPLLSVWITKRNQTFLQNAFGMEGRLASDNLIREPIRTAVAMAALMIGISQVINISSLVLSYKRSILDWMDETVNASLFVQGASNISARLDTPLDASLGDALQALPEVETVYRFRTINMDYEDSPASVIAVDMQNYLKHASPVMIHGRADAQELVSRNHV